MVAVVGGEDRMHLTARFCVAVDVEHVSVGERQRRQLRLALAEVSQLVGRPDIRARVTHHLADEVIDGGRRQRREEVGKETRVVCAP